MAFRITSYFNGNLSPGTRRVDAILTVAADGEGAAGAPSGRIVVLGIDCSGSMFNDARKIEAAKRTARQAIRSLPPDVRFMVVAFADHASVIVGLRPADEANKQEAERAVQALHNMGGTAMSTALAEVRKVVAEHPGHIAWMYFLTDGKNEGEENDVLEREIARCKGLFQCDCRGIGTDWQPDELRLISNALLGTSDAVPDPSALDADVREAMARALSKTTADVRLDLWRPGTVKLLSLRQMQPETIDITDQGTKLTERVMSFGLGAWGKDEERDYAAVFEIQPGEEGEQMMVCRPSVAWSEGGVERVEKGGEVLAQWTSDAELTARISPEVAHYTGQAELAASIKEGLEARGRGDEAEATRLLGRATQIAHESGNEDVTRRLSKVVDVVDADAGTVRLKRADRGAELELDMGSTRTVRRNPSQV